MTVVRIGIADAHPLAHLARSIAVHLADSPTAASVGGTVLLGLDDPYLVETDDERPRLALPLAWPRPLGRLEIGTLLQAADVVVLLDPSEAALVPGLSRCTIPIMQVEPPRDLRGCLIGPGPYESREFALALTSNSSLRSSLESARDEPLDDTWEAEVAELILEVASRWGSEVGAPMHRGTFPIDWAT